MRNLTDLTVVVPCFNEQPNIAPMVEKLTVALQGIDWEVVFVDDNSPDGTADAVREVAQNNSRVRLIHRIGRRGLAGACIEGILSSTAPLAAVIDGDLQHDESKLRDMYDAMQSGADIAIGSRNVEGGSAGTGLTAIRKKGSDMANSLAKRLMKIEATDPMSGFFMVRRESFNAIVTDLQTQGFKILADMLAASKGRWKTVEIPYIFRERQHGESKMDSAVTLEFLGLLASRMTGGLMPIRFVLFIMVGLSGVFVQLAAVWLALLVIPSFAIAQTIGVIVAMTTNFFLNNALTYRDRKLTGTAMLRGLLSFYAVCSVGAVANVGVAELIFRLFPYWAFASVIGAIVGAFWNFLASSLVTWRTR